MGFFYSVVRRHEGGMESILIVAGIAAVLWFVLSGNFRTRMQNPQTLRPDQLEDSIIELKKRILVTSAYTDERKYQSLYDRLSALMGQVLERHKHYVLDVEAQRSTRESSFQSSMHHDMQGMSYTTFSLRHDMNPAAYDPKFLIYACFFLWQGGHAKGIGNIDANPDLMLRILDYLIEQKQYPPAMFFKGMVLKYGKKVYAECFPNEAREILKRSQTEGIGSAAIELEQLDKYAQLEGIKSIHLEA